MKRSPREFSFGEVMTLTGVSARSLDYWATSGFLPPSISEAKPGTGTKRVYSYADVVAARVAKYLRSAGLPFESLRGLVTRFRLQQYTANVGPQGRLFIFGAQAIAVSNRKELANAIKKADESYPACPVILPLGRILGDLKTELDRLPDRQLESRGRVLQDRKAESDRAQNKQLDLFSEVNQIAKRPAVRTQLLKGSRPDEQKVG